MEACCRKKRSRNRSRSSVTDWLVGQKLQAENKIGLAGTSVSVPIISAEIFEIDNLENISEFEFPITPDETVISATKENIWAVMNDYEMYSEWNPFQYNVSIYEPRKPDGNVQYEMKVKGFGTVMQDVLYVDEERFILIYGKKDFNFRAQWLTDNEEGLTVYHSIDCMMSGAIIPFVKISCVLSKIIQGFNTQHQALKERAEQLGEENEVFCNDNK